MKMESISKGNTNLEQKKQIYEELLYAECHKKGI